jgi:hypothetical protein
VDTTDERLEGPREVDAVVQRFSECLSVSLSDLRSLGQVEVMADRTARVLRATLEASLPVVTLGPMRAVDAKGNVVLLDVGLALEGLELPPGARARLVVGREAQGNVFRLTVAPPRRASW